MEELLKNRALVASTASWMIAQMLKVLFSYVETRRLDFRRFVSPGGMPSSHAAAVSCLVVLTAREFGLSSTHLAIVVVFALIVMYDAAGVRRAAGKQAAVLNTIVREIHALRGLRNERLRELLGHTPVEVIAGALLGITVAIMAL
ncbi:MAG: divergent PAP2 family protein [Firmicutes bacterium]|nr:divergent PAP2 family protein [Bacillota bacterium]